MSRPMLHDFLTAERENILSLAKSTASNSQGIRVTTVMEEGWSVFYSELIGLMKLDAPFASHGEKGVHTIGAEEQGKEYLRLGYTISEVVHSYGLICQAITATASEKAFEITSREFQQLNLSLDTAIAEAVTEYDKLPANAGGYLERIAEVCDVLIDMVSTGPDRLETILLRNPLQG